MSIGTILSIGKYYDACIEEADQYLKTAVGGLKREAVFTPEILYNILGMSIEKYCMALLYFKENMPDNHTFYDLLDAMGRVVTVPEDLKQELSMLQGFQEICSMSAYVRKAPDRATILDMIETTRKLESFVKETCKQGTSSPSL